MLVVNSGLHQYDASREHHIKLKANRKIKKNQLYSLILLIALTTTINSISCMTDNGNCDCSKRDSRTALCPIECSDTIPNSKQSHDNFHPDHADLESMLPESMYNYNTENGVDDDDGGGAAAAIGGRGGDAKLVDNDERILRHRKVYLTKSKNFDPVIHPISITIPVKVDNDFNVEIPRPKPVFKMKKYTYQDTKAETELVPVTTTIIKPVGVSKDQILNE